LRRKAGRVRDANQSRRLLALASILDGEACCDAWNSLMAMPDRVASIAARSWAKAS